MKKHVVIRLLEKKERGNRVQYSRMELICDSAETAKTQMPIVAENIIKMTGEYYELKALLKRKLNSPAALDEEQTGRYSFLTGMDLEHTHSYIIRDCDYIEDTVLDAVKDNVADTVEKVKSVFKKKK